MEKSVRSAIQRHLRGWAPYPHVRVSETEKGHCVQWGDAIDILNMALYAEIHTTGKPSQRDFTIVKSKGSRVWQKSDMHIMDHNESQSALRPWAFPVALERVAALSQDDCMATLTHLRAAWHKNQHARNMLNLVEIQNFSPAIALHTSLDVLVAASGSDACYEPETHIEPLVRILLGHAMDSDHGTWACTFSQVDTNFNNLVLLAWREPGGWNVSIIPNECPILFSDYHWEDTTEGLIFYDRLPANAHEDMMMGRGSRERYLRSHNVFNAIGHRKRFCTLVTSKPIVLDPDKAWTDPIGAVVRDKLPEASEYSLVDYSLMRAFEEKAFDYLSSNAKTPAGRALGACMNVVRSLSEPTKHMKDFQKRLVVWNTAIQSVSNKEEVNISSELFEGIGI